MTKKVSGKGSAINGKGGLKGLWFVQMIENKERPGAWSVSGQGLILGHVWQDRWLCQYSANLPFKRVHSIHEIAQMFLFDTQARLNEFLDGAKLPAVTPAEGETNTPLQAPGDEAPATFESGEPVPPSQDELLRAIEELN